MGATSIKWRSAEKQIEMSSSDVRSSSSGRRIAIFISTLLGLGIYMVSTESGLEKSMASYLEDIGITVPSNSTTATTPGAVLVQDDQIRDYQSDNTNAANVATSTRSVAIDLSRLPHIPPSRMETKYHEMWDLVNSTIDIPEEYRNPFNTTIGGEPGSGSERLPRPSLKILEEVIHGEKYRAEFEAVEAYMETIYPKIKKKRKINQTNAAISDVSPPSCLVPDLQATGDLARRTVELRKTIFPKPQKIWHRNVAEKRKIEWQYKKLTLPLPILNVGFPKCGSTTMSDYFACIGIKTSHLQCGARMHSSVKQPGNTGWEISYAQAHLQIDLDYGPGFFPQMTLLDELHEGEPNSTFVMFFRPIRDWIKSIENFYDMKLRMDGFEVPGMFRTPEEIKAIQSIHKEIDNAKMSYKNGEIDKATKQRNIRSQEPFPKITAVQMAKWWCGHVLHLREYVKEYPSHALIELDLYDMEGSEGLLYDLFRADTDAHFASEGKKTGKMKCLGHKNVGHKNGSH